MYPSRSNVSMTLSLLRLLLVEDNASLRGAMKSGLEATGKVVIIAETIPAKKPCRWPWPTRRRDLDGRAAGRAAERCAGCRCHPARESRSAGGVLFDSDDERFYRTFWLQAFLRTTLRAQEQLPAAAHGGALLGMPSRDAVSSIRN